MTKNHLKAIAAPRTWPVQRKKTTFIARPHSGAHPLSHSMALQTFLTDVLGVAKTAQEVRYILQTNNILVNGKRVKDSHYAVGLFDVLSLPSSHYRVVFTPLGKLTCKEIPENEASLLLVRVLGKTIIKKKTQLHVSGGRNILAEKNTCAVGDSLLLAMPSQSIQDHVPLQSKHLVYIAGGKHLGAQGTISAIEKDHIIVEMKDNTLMRTLKKYAIALGKDKPLVTLQ